MFFLTVKVIRPVIKKQIIEIKVKIFSSNKSSVYFTTNLMGIIKDKSNSSISKLFMHNAGVKLNLRVYMHVSVYAYECECVCVLQQKRGLHRVYLIFCKMCIYGQEMSLSEPSDSSSAVGPQDWLQLSTTEDILV